jgi:hypothetical protein
MTQLWEYHCPGRVDIGFTPDGQMIVSCYDKESSTPPANLTPPFSEWRTYTDGGNPAFTRSEPVLSPPKEAALQIAGQSLDDRGRWMTGRDIPVTHGQLYTLDAHIDEDLTAGDVELVVTYWSQDLTYLGKHPTGSTLPALDGAAFARLEFRCLQGLVGTAQLSGVQFSQPQSLEDRLLATAAARQLIQFNPNAALQKAIFADDFVPNSGEFDVAGYRGQRAEHLQTGQVRVYYCPIGDWTNVQYVRRGEPSEVALPQERRA